MRWDQLDFYGDCGELLKRTAPFHSLPGFVKEAHLESKPDGEHALVLVEGSNLYPLFPMTDAGNTAISGHYLVHNAQYLPEDAVKIAAANIGASCIAYGIGVPDELLALSEGSTEVSDPVYRVKSASVYPNAQPGMTTAAAPLQMPPAQPTVAGAPKPPRGNVTPQLQVPVAKTASVIGQLSTKTTPGGAIQAKSASGMKFSAGKLGAGAYSNVPKPSIGTPKVAALKPSVDEIKKLTAPLTNRISKALKSGNVNTVSALDLTEEQLEKLYGGGGDAIKKTSSLTAPYEHVQAAATWFNEGWTGIHPAERVKVAQHLVETCENLRIPLVDEAYVYARGVGDLGHTKVALRTRKILSGNDVYDDLDKLAADATTEEMVQLIWEADEATGLSRFWNSRIEDPFLSVMAKVAAEEKSLLEAGTARVAPENIIWLATNNREQVEMAYGEDFADKFQKRPVEVFNSLPDPNKEHLARLANSRDI